MAKLLFNIFLVAFLMMGLTGKSWAFASRHHHHNGQNIGNDNSGPSGHDQGQDGVNQWNSNSTGDTHNDPGPSGDSPGNNNYYYPDPDPGNPPKSDFPVAPVPEPMTLTLLGTGLAGFLLRRKLH
ncbi:MAG: PEP-CTERM sorting domain-containing protein [Ginsengibacter sp.]